MSSPGPPNPHDAVFRYMLANPVNAASQLRSVLPPALVSRLDLTRLVQEPASFVDSDLSSRHSDLVFSVPLSGRPAFVYLLAEHQSSTDALMAFRMLRYTMRLWERYLANNPTATVLPAVIPLVVHHNRRPWNAPTDLADLIDIDDTSALALPVLRPCFGFLLDDLAAIDPDELRDRPLTSQARLTLLLLRTALGNTGIGELLSGWRDDLRAVLDLPDAVEILEALLRYALCVGDTPTGQFQELFAALGPDAEEAYMTTADTLRAEGRAQGLANGRSQGRAEGRAEMLVELLVDQLTFKFGPLPQAVLDTVANATTDQLRTWSNRILTATTLDDTLR